MVLFISFHLDSLIHLVVLFCLLQAPVLGEFQLVAECVDDLRNLVLKFAPPEPITEVKGTREKVG